MNGKIIWPSTQIWVMKPPVKGISNNVVAITTLVRVNTVDDMPTLKKLMTDKMVELINNTHPEPPNIEHWGLLFSAPHTWWPDDIGKKMSITLGPNGDTFDTDEEYKAWSYWMAVHPMCVFAPFSS